MFPGEKLPRPETNSVTRAPAHNLRRDVQRFTGYILPPESRPGVLESLTLCDVCD